jgi:transmembrane sensor
MPSASSYDTCTWRVVVRMTKLRAPLARELEARVDEATLQRIWGRIGARRAGSRLAPRRARVGAWALAGAALALVIVLTLAGSRWQAQRSNLSALASIGPLTSHAGQSLSVLGETSASRHELSDGSAIALDPGSRLEVLENDSKTFVSVLRSGRGSFSVRPGGSRRWIVEAGLATVEVVGTRFSVARLARGVLVRVEHGVVVVRSNQLQDEVQRLTAGEELLIGAPAPAARTEPDPIVLAPPPVSSSASAKPNNALTLDALLARATEQRRSGDSRGAEASLRQALAEHIAEPQAALAAFSLGKLLLDSQGRPADAARAFTRCLALSPPKSLAEDAWFRLAEANARSGNLSGAAAAAREYRARYPAGRHARDVARWLDGH